MWIRNGCLAVLVSCGGRTSLPDADAGAQLDAELDGAAEHDATADAVGDEGLPTCDGLNDCEVGSCQYGFCCIGTLDPKSLVCACGAGPGCTIPDGCCPACLDPPWDEHCDVVSTCNSCKKYK